MEAFTGMLAEYYHEVEPVARKKLFAAMAAEGALPPMTQRLYELRYKDLKAPDKEVDLFLWYYVNLQQYFSAPRLLWKKTRRDIRAIFRQMGLSPDEPRTQEDERVLYWEFRNAARRYFGTFSASSYGRKLFGALPAKEDERLLRMREDARKLSVGNAEKYDLAAETELFCLAIDDEFKEYFHSEESLSGTH